jgi:hypothetical protein
MRKNASIQGRSPRSILKRRPDRRHNWAFAIIGLAAMAASPSILGASTWRGDALINLLSLAPLKIWMFRLQPQLILTDLGYDTNVYSRPDAIPDYSLTVGPQINGFVSVAKKVIFTFTESPRYVYYLHTTRERTWNNYLKGDINFLFNKVFITAGAVYNDSKEHWSWEIDLRPRLKETGVQGSILWQPTQKTSFSLDFRQSTYSYENLTIDQSDIRDRLNRTETGVSVSVYHELTNQIRAFIELEHGTMDFQNPGNLNSSRSDTAYGGVNFSQFGRIRGRIRLGYKTYRPLASGLPDFQGLVGDTDVQVTIVRPLVIRGSYGRNVRPSVWFGNAFYVENTWGTGTSLYVLRRHFRFDYDFSHVNNVYPAVLPAAGSPNALPTNRGDQILTHRIGLFYRIGADLGLGLQAGFINRKVNIYNWDVSSDFIGLSLIHGF